MWTVTVKTSDIFVFSRNGTLYDRTTVLGLDSGRRSLNEQLAVYKGPLTEQHAVLTTVDDFIFLFFAQKVRWIMNQRP